MKLASFSKSYSMCAEWRSYSMFDRAIALWTLALHRAHTHLLSTVIGPVRNFYPLKLHGNTCTSPAIPFKKDTGKIWINFKKFSSVGTLITWTRQIMMNEVRKGAFLPPPPPVSRMLPQIVNSNLYDESRSTYAIHTDYFNWSFSKSRKNNSIRKCDFFTPIELLRKIFEEW